MAPARGRVSTPSLRSAPDSYPVDRLRLPGCLAIYWHSIFESRRSPVTDISKQSGACVRARSRAWRRPPFTQGRGTASALALLAGACGVAQLPRAKKHIGSTARRSRSITAYGAGASFFPAPDEVPLIAPELTSCAIVRILSQVCSCTVAEPAECEASQRKNFRSAGR